MSNSKIFTVDKFLGLHESANGTTELKMGEASRIENFYITDDYNLKIRPGISVLQDFQIGDSIVGFWDGLIGECHWTLIFYVEGHSYDVRFRTISRNDAAKARNRDGVYRTDLRADYPVKFFSLSNRLYIVGATTKATHLRSRILYIADDGYYYEGSAYTPLVLTGCAPAGGGTELEPLNIFTQYLRIQFSADGNSVGFHLPSIVVDIQKITIDNVEVSVGQYDSNRYYVFDEAPPKGVNNVEFVCGIQDSNLDAACEKFLSMRHCESYNGSTDTRLFFYGDGTNICYYTGTPTYGDGLYIPSVNEIAVDSSASPITGMRRHCSQLMAFKPDGTFTISYDPVTLEDGRIVAGFYVRPASRSVGNDMDNQIQTVNNYPRTLCNGSLYEWRNNASYYQDERYAKRISDKIALTLASADPEKIVTCDDNASQTYYMFLNDDRGTVLVNRYQLDAWSVYTGSMFRGVKHAAASTGDLLFATEDRLCYFDALSGTDGPPHTPISAVWESGFMSFGADYKRKYSSSIWVSMLPELSSKMEITVETDRRDQYLVKYAGLPLFSFDNIDFSNFSFLTSRAPKIKRIKIKVKKFVYYKLIFRVTHPGAKATVLGYDQQVRYSSNVK